MSGMGIAQEKASEIREHVDQLEKQVAGVREKIKELQNRLSHVMVRRPQSPTPTGATIEKFSSSSQLGEELERLVRNLDDANSDLNEIIHELCV